MSRWIWRDRPRRAIGMEHMRNEISVAARDRFRSLPLTAVICLLLFVQGAALAHSHENDPQVRYDCDICLKIGSSTDVIATGHFDSPVSPVHQEWLDAKVELPFLPLLDIRSRAPPQA